MQESDKKKFLEVLTAMSELYDSPLSSISIDIYWKAVSKYPLNKFLAAAKQHTETSKWMPKPSDFIDGMQGNELSVGERSNLAWLGVASAARSIGGNRGVCFDDPLIHAVIRSLGGWVSLCRGKQEYFNSTVRNAFIKTYEHMAACADKGNILGTIASLAPLGGALGDDTMYVSTGLPKGKQHAMFEQYSAHLLLEQAQNRGETNEKLSSIIHGISETKKIGGATRGSVDEDVQGATRSGQSLKKTKQDDRRSHGEKVTTPRGAI